MERKKSGAFCNVFKSQKISVKIILQVDPLNYSFVFSILSKPATSLLFHHMSNLTYALTLFALHKEPHQLFIQSKQYAVSMALQNCISQTNQQKTY